MTNKNSLFFYPIDPQVCSRGYFGPDCRNTCGQCLNVSQCHYINGSCLAGCVHGYRGDYCNESLYLKGEHDTYHVTFIVICFDVLTLLWRHN